MALDTNSNSNINVSSCTSFIDSTDGRADQASSCNNTPRTARRYSAKSTPMRALSRTPSSTTKTPTSGDRFIPAIDDNLDIAHFYLSQDERHYSTQETERPIASNYVSTLEDTIFEGRTQSKILSFKAKAPKPQTIRDTTNLYYATEPRRTSPKKRHRHIPSAPDKILDAPELADDYYLNVLAWGSNNVLAVGLGNTVYLLNATTSKITQLPNQDAITSLAWHSSSNYLAVGTNAGTVQIWDTEKEKRLREMRGHLCRVGVVDWADYVLSSGSRDTNIFHHDVRVQNHHISTFSGHSQEVCGLKWNSGHTLLASGANDNQANIWDIRNTRQRTNTPTTPLYTLPHFAAVKALAWCPFQSHLLATGGGTNDRQIHFWSSSTGSCLNSIDTKAQVCQLLWSTNYKEIVSSHGFSQNNLTVWSYPSMSKVADLSGHTSRVLYLAMSPDGETVVSGAGDETLRFWKVFEKERKALSLPKHTPSQIHGINTMIR